MKFINALMDRLSYTRKMGLISSLFILPTLISSFFLIKILSTEVVKAENEHNGLIYRGHPSDVPKYS